MVLERFIPNYTPTSQFSDVNICEIIFSDVHFWFLSLKDVQGGAAFICAFIFPASDVEITLTKMASAAPPRIDTLDAGYAHLSATATNCNEHFETLREYAARCKSATELGCSEMLTCWALAKGLSQNGGTGASLTCVDAKPAPAGFDNVASLVQSSGGVKMKFVQGDCLKLKLPQTDMLLIDTFHTYPQLKKELERHSGNVGRYIAILNTEVDGQTSELVRLFYMYDIDETCARLGGCSHKDICKGLMPAIREFVQDSKGAWGIARQFANNNGLVILERL